MNDKSAAKKLTEFDPALVEIVERKLDAYRGRVSAEMLAHFREEALALLATHPYSAALVKQLGAAPVVQHSTTVPAGGTSTANKGAAPPDARREAPKRGRGGGR
jgi:hypothetical protein